jgi:hypothetical protein
VAWLPALSSNSILPDATQSSQPVREIKVKCFCVAGSPQSHALRFVNLNDVQHGNDVRLFPDGPEESLLQLFHLPLFRRSHYSYMCEAFLKLNLASEDARDNDDEASDLVNPALLAQHGKDQKRGHMDHQSTAPLTQEHGFQAFLFVIAVAQDEVHAIHNQPGREHQSSCS